MNTLALHSLEHLRLRRIILPCCCGPSAHFYVTLTSDFTPRAFLEGLQAFHINARPLSLQIVTRSRHVEGSGRNEREGGAGERCQGRRRRVGDRSRLCQRRLGEGAALGREDGRGIGPRRVDQLQHTARGGSSAMSVSQLFQAGRHLATTSRYCGESKLFFFVRVILTLHACEFESKLTI